MKTLRLLAIIVSLVLTVTALAPLAMAGNHTHNGDRRAEVSQRAPIVYPPDLSANDDEPGDPDVRVHPYAGTVRSTSLEVTIEDPNGHNDIQSVTVTIYKPDNVTVHIGSFSAAKASGIGTEAVFGGSFDMDYHDPPGEYHVKTTATDRNNLEDTNWGRFVFSELSAISVDEATIHLNPGGSQGTAVTPGNDTRNDPSIIAFKNAGNVPIDAELSGSDLKNNDESETIAVGSVKHALGAGFDPEASLTSVATQVSLNLAPGPSSSTDIYFAIEIPDGTAADTYTGTATITAVKAS